MANQSLYYLDNENLGRYVNEMYDLCNKGGVCFFTMMSTDNYYFSKVECSYNNGLSKVVLDERLIETSYINFVSNASELVSIFHPFSKLYVGDYNMFNLYDYEGSGHHYIFIGIKE